MKYFQFEDKTRRLIGHLHRAPLSSALICTQDPRPLPRSSSRKMSLRRVASRIPPLYFWRTRRRTPRTIKSPRRHPPQPPLVRSAFQGLADHPIGLSTAPAPVRSLHCASSRRAYVPRSRTRRCVGQVARYVAARTRQMRAHTHARLKLANASVTRDAETHSRPDRPRSDGRHHVPLHPRARARSHTRAKTDRVAFRDTLTGSRINGRRDDDGEIGLDRRVFRSRARALMPSNGNIANAPRVFSFLCFRFRSSCPPTAHPYGLPIDAERAGKPERRNSHRARLELEFSPELLNGG